MSKPLARSDHAQCYRPFFLIGFTTYTKGASGMESLGDYESLPDCSWETTHVAITGVFVLGSHPILLWSGRRKPLP